MDYKKIGIFLANLRKEKSLTQTNLADILNVTHQAISRWETGESIPDVQMLISLSQFYHITVDEILNGELKEKEDLSQSINKQTSFEQLYTKVKKMNIIAFSLTLVGLLVFYGITWVYYDEVIGFMIQLIFLICSGVIFVFSYHDMITYLLNIKNMNKELSNRGMNYLKKATMIGWTIIILSICLSIPYILFDNTSYRDSILKITYYLSVVLYFIVIGLLLSLFIITRIDQNFYHKYGINQFLKFQTKATNKVFKYIYLPFIVVLCFASVLLNRNILFVLLVLMGLLILDEIIKIIQRKSYIILRSARIIMALTFIIYDILMPSKFRTVMAIKYTLAQLLFGLVILSIYYFISFFKKHKKYSIDKKINLLCQLTTITLFFITLFSVYVDSKNTHGLDGPYTFSIENSFSHYYIFLYMIIDSICRIYINKTDEK